MSATESGLIARIIAASVTHAHALVIALVVAGVLGIATLRTLPVDALPDLSDVQVILRTTYPGQAPRIVEDQVTFPLTNALAAVPGATTVRGYSFFGDSFVNVLFADGTDPYWARSRVLESLAQTTSRLPAGAQVALGPDATGVGWIYEYALVDRTGAHDLAELRALQDWQLRFQLQSVDGVAEVASVGGMVQQYQVVIDPQKLTAYGVTLRQVRDAIVDSNREVGGGALDMADAEYVIRASGYVRDLDELRSLPVKFGAARTVTLGDIADVRLGPEMRRGIVDLDGQGEAVGGIVIMRQGANPRAVIRALTARLQATALPPGVEIVETYNRAGLIDRTIATLDERLIEECFAVLLVCVAFLLHARSALVIVITLPIAIGLTFLAMRVQGLPANLMSLGGIAIAIGAMVDAAIVMVENVHRKLEQAGDDQSKDGERGSTAHLVIAGCVEVGPAVFVSLLIAALSFLPMLLLEGQEGRLFAPLAFTKTYAMLAGALVSIAVVPALISLLIRGRVRQEHANPLNRICAAVYRPVLNLALAHPRGTLAGAGVVVLLSLWPLMRVGTEFMPALDEGDLLYMPMTLPGISPDAARALLQQTDRLIRMTPEVARVFGKAGRAQTATDPAPFEMFETVIRLQPRSEWRAGMTLDSIRREIDAHLQLPGVANTWSAPIRSRIDMLTTGVRAAVGVQVLGPDLSTIEAVGVRIEELLRDVPGAKRVFAERTATGRYIDVDIDRPAASRFGIAIADIHTAIETAVGGTTVSEVVAGRERFPIQVRYAADWRDSLDKLRMLPLTTTRGTQLLLGDVARVAITDGPMVIRSEAGQPVGSVLIDVDGRDLGGFVAEAKARLAAAKVLPQGYSLRWAGQYEHLERARARLALVIPLVLVTIVAMLYLCFRRGRDVLLVLGALPFAFCGGIWLLWLLDYRLSVAAAVGFVALGGIAVETGVVMLLYLEQAWRARRARTTYVTAGDLEAAIVEGALLRLRPKLMTVLALTAALLPIMLGAGAGSEVMRRIAAPMVGGLISATVLTLVVIPVLYRMSRSRELTTQVRT
jgi:Cu(I)/Ag(I) efflux system membrane protein CusA/SilA